MRVESPTYFLRLGIVVAVSVAFLLGQQGGLVGPLRGLIMISLRPGWAAAQAYAQIRQTVYADWLFLTQGGSRLAAAEHELARQQVAAEVVAELTKENALLRQELGRVVPEQAIYRFYGGGTNWFIDGGCRQGVQPGAPVLYEGALVGQIDKVEANFSSVQTIMDRSFRLPVEVGTASAQGLFMVSRGAPEVSQLAADQPLSTGDQVISLGFAQVPPHLILGKVTIIQTEAGTGMARAIVEPTFSPAAISWVRVPREKDQTCF